MADVSKIRVDGVDYDMKDVTARQSLLYKVGFSYYPGDMNELVTNGVYRLHTNLNLPPEVQYSQALVMRGQPEGDTCAQLVIPYASAKMMFRGGRLQNNTWIWQDWATVYSDKNSTLPSVTTADNGKILKVVNGVWTAVAE